MNKIKFLALILLSAFWMIFSSCDSDDWRMERDLVGIWRIVETSGNLQCPYRRNDLFEFTYDNSFYAWGDGLNEEGVWHIDNWKCFVDFDFDGRDDLVGHIRQFDHDYLVMDITDYFYQTRYTLRMIRY